MSCGNTIKVRQGSTARFRVNIKQPSNGAPVPISTEKFRIIIEGPGGAILLHLTSGTPIVDPAGSNAYDPTLPPASSSIDITDPTNGIALITLSAHLLTTLPPGTHRFEIEKLWSSGSVQTIASGEFVVERHFG